MIKNRFHDLTKNLRIQNTFERGSDNAVTEASKLLEINYTLRQADREIDRCKFAIIEHLKRHEAGTVTLVRLGSEVEKITTSRDKLNDFAYSVRRKMMKIAETQNILLAMINEDEKNNGVSSSQNAGSISEAIRKIGNDRENVVAEIDIIERSVESLKRELKNIEALTRFEKGKNVDLRATLIKKRKDAIERYREASARHDRLLQWKYPNKRESPIKVEKKEAFFD